MTENARDFVDSRTHGMTETGKVRFFKALEEVASSDDSRLELITVSQKARETFRDSCRSWTDEIKALISGLALIAINKNQPLVKSVAANYRQATRHPAPNNNNVA